eukprot:gb/GECH01007856.1/.p1 GENE.gb/GECH01007856.1/~~gb/GECH01007856.1/.p1  ORF type:complete len:203 (+),score=31.12 gb/GECH01007856.1/:1-609(+)
MKFKFCGDLDSPEWLLAAITSMSKLTSVRTKVLALQIIKYYLGNPLDYSKIDKLTSVVEYERSEVKGILAALDFIVTNAVRFNVKYDVLVDELQQLGMPRESSVSVSRSYIKNKDKLKTVLDQQTLKLPRLENLKWRVDYTVASSMLKEVNSPSVQLQMQIQDPLNKQATNEHFSVSAEKFNALIHELRAARKIMNEVETSD